MSREICILQQDTPEQGGLQVNVTSTIGIQPIAGAAVKIFSGQTQEEELTTDSSGQTPAIQLPAPPLAYSQEPNQPQPFAEYTIQVEAPGYRPVEVSNVAIFPEEMALQPVEMEPLETSSGDGEENIVVPPNALWGDFPPKIAEDEIKPMDESGEIVLSRVVIPEYVIVHDGPPSDRGAKDYYVRYRDYIKNVASGEIYSTWPDAALRANILAIMSFTLNRVYTEWYRNKSYDFTITSSTAYDQTWSFGRTIYRNISQIVDEMFNNYLSRPNVRQPILTQYCDGKTVSCPNWLPRLQGRQSIKIPLFYAGLRGCVPIEIIDVKSICIFIIHNFFHNGR